MTFDELERLLLQLMGTSPEALEQQMRSHIKRETLVGGKRVTRQELPELPEDAVTTVPGESTSTGTARESSSPDRATRQVTNTVILPPARPDSITRCASTMSSKLNTLAGLAW